MTEEKAFELSVKRAFKFQGFLVEKMSLINKPGIPDLLVSKDWKSLFIELKVMRGKHISEALSAEQISYAIENLRKIKILIMMKMENYYAVWHPTQLDLMNIERVDIYQKEWSYLPEMYIKLRNLKYLTQEVEDRWL